MTVTASLVVDFSDGAQDGLLQAEIDSREDGFNQGKTSFIPGDDAYFLVYLGSNTALKTVAATLGAVSLVQTAGREVEPETVQFTEQQREATLGYPVSGGLSVSWMGANPGAAQLRGDNQLVLPSPGLGIARVTYKTTFRVYRLSNLPSTVNGKGDYSVLIALTGEVVA